MEEKKIEEVDYKEKYEELQKNYDGLLKVAKTLQAKVEGLTNVLAQMGLK